MTMCPYCGEVYDESDYAKCPVCHPDGRVMRIKKNTFTEWLNNQQKSSKKK